MKALTNLPYPIFLALTASIGGGLAVFITQSIWMAAISLAGMAPFAYLFARSNLRRMNLPPDTTAEQYFAARRAPPK
jgi:hypothetical protein